jgi:hypothetical protein
VNDKIIQKSKLDYKNNLVGNLHMLCKDGRLVIPKRLQESKAIAWYHHYLQHPGHTRLEETMKLAMYWTNMRTSVRQFVKQCKSCQVTNAPYKYGELPLKLVLKQSFGKHYM